MIKLTPTQTKAYDDLTPKFRSAYQIGHGIPTLDALVRKGYAVKKVRPGASFPGMARSQTLYRGTK